MASKGQGISINVIVIAAIALLVLVILSTLVIRSGGVLNRGTQCEGSGGVCRVSTSAGGDGCSAGETQDTNKACEKDSFDQARVCCIKL
jgi:hypothetical protein